MTARKIKRSTLAALALAAMLAMAMALAGCAASESTSQASPSSQASSSSSSSASTQSQGQASIEGVEGKTLVAYFSGSGNTERVAQDIATALDADLFAIEPVTPYTEADLNWRDEGSRVSAELLEQMAGTGTWLEGHRFASSATDAEVEEWLATISVVIPTLR